MVLAVGQTVIVQKTMVPTHVSAKMDSQEISVTRITQLTQVTAGCYFHVLIPNKINIIKCIKFNYTLYTDLPSVRFDGSCRGQNKFNEPPNSDNFKMGITVDECYKLCKTGKRNVKNCDAFAFTALENSCYFYSQGPYTHGTGVDGTTCYIMPEGII